MLSCCYARCCLPRCVRAAVVPESSPKLPVCTGPRRHGSSRRVVHDSPLDRSRPPPIPNIICNLLANRCWLRHCVFQSQKMQGYPTSSNGFPAMGLLLRRLSQRHLSQTPLLHQACLSNGQVSSACDHRGIVSIRRGMRKCWAQLFLELAAWPQVTWRNAAVGPGR